MSLLEAPRDRARVVLALLGLVITIATWRFLPGLLGAVILYVVCDRTHRWLAQRMAPRIAALIVILGVVVLLMVPAISLITIMIGRAPAIVDQAVSGQTFDRLAAAQIGRIQVGSVLASIGTEIRDWLPAQALRLLGGLFQTTLNLVIALFGLYFLLLTGRNAWPRIKDFLPLSSDNAESLRVRFRSVTEAMLVGIVVIAIVQGFIVGVAFWLVGFTDPLFWGGITAMVSVLPVFGSGLVWAPGVLVLVANSQYGAAATLLVLGAGVASNIDNLIRPIVYRRMSNLHPMITIVGAFAGVIVFGLLGVLMGPLILSYFFELLRAYRAEFGPETIPGTTPAET